MAKGNEFEVILSAALIILMVSAPVFAWKETRKLGLPVLFCYGLFLFVNGEFVWGVRGTGHDVIWNWHSWSAIIQQWIHSDVELGWNPYWGAGQPIALINNLLCILPTVAFGYLFDLLGLHLHPTIFFNLVFLFGYLNVCTGSLLLFRILYSNPLICLLGFVSLLFGGLLYAEAHQTGINVLSFLPYLLFLLIYFYRTRQPGALVFFLFILGLSVNFYLPSIVYLALLVFLLIVLAGGLKNPGALRGRAHDTIKAAFSRPGLVVTGLALFLATAGPFISNYVEMGDYVSPTRGFAAEASNTQLSYQKSVHTPLQYYDYLYDYETTRRYDPEHSFQAKTHGGFYIGMLPFLGILLAPLLGGNGLFMAFAVIMVLFGAAQPPLWDWITAHVPLADTIRHTFAFARIATVSLIVVSLSGFMGLVSDRYPLWRKTAAGVTAAVTLYFLLPGDLSSLQTWNFIASCLFLALITVPWQAVRPRMMEFSMFLVLAATATDTLFFSAHQAYFEGWNLKMKDISYPNQWKSLPEKLKGMPFDHKPVFNKEAVWSNRIPNYIILLQRDFAQFLLHNHLLVKRNPEAMGTRIIPASLKLKEVNGDIFHLVPQREGMSPDQVALQALKRIVGIRQPVITPIGGSSPAGQLLNAQDHDIQTFWKPVPEAEGSNPWIAFAVQDGFTPDRLELWYEPRMQESPQDGVELWLSHDNAQWTFAQNLQPAPVPAGAPQDAVQYPLEKPVTQKYFKLVFKHPSPIPVAEVDLTESAAIPAAPAPGAGSLLPHTSKTSNRIAMDITANTDAYLLRLENHHSGWTASLDGKEVPILRVYPNFQMVTVPKGKHTLAFEFHSLYPLLVKLFVITGFLGGFAFLLWLGNWNWSCLRKRFNV